MAGAAALDAFDKIGDRSTGWNRDNEMKVIGGASNSVKWAIEGEAFGLNEAISFCLDSCCDQRSAIAGRPNQMIIGAP